MERGPPEGVRTLRSERVRCVRIGRQDVGPVGAGEVFGG
jgi:hypothetical protein